MTTAELAQAYVDDNGIPLLSGTTLTFYADSGDSPVIGGVVAAGPPSPDMATLLSDAGFEIQEELFGSYGAEAFRLADGGCLIFVANYLASSAAEFWFYLTYFGVAAGAGVGPCANAFSLFWGVHEPLGESSN